MRLGRIAYESRHTDEAIKLFEHAVQAMDDSTLADQIEQADRLPYAKLILLQQIDAIALVASGSYLRSHIPKAVMAMKSREDGGGTAFMLNTIQTVLPSTFH